MDQIVEKVSNLNIADSSNNNLKKNRIQVSNTKKPLFFYVNLAKRGAVFEALLRCTRPSRLWDLYAFTCGPSKYCGTDPKVRLLDEYFRLLGIRSMFHVSDDMIDEGSFTLSNDSWRISKTNSNYSLCGTYLFALMLPKSISFVVTGLIEIQALPYLGISVADFTLDEKAELLFVDQSITTAAVLGVLFSLTNTLQPLPEDLYRYGMQLTTTRATFQV